VPMNFVTKRQVFFLYDGERNRPINIVLTLTPIIMLTLMPDLVCYVPIRICAA
jgi:hypothetical protein